VAPDITSLGKPLGVRCLNLRDDWKCSIYDERPPVCSGYRPDEICLQVAAPTLEERVKGYLELFDLSETESSG